MKIRIVRSSERGQTKLNWLDSRHSFSFGNYHDPKKMNFGLLRVFNDDVINAKNGFGMHFHDNMEIISIGIQGAIEHKDSMGNLGVIKENEIQTMSAGSGIKHSEFNNSTNQAHFLQIWIESKEQGIEPRYEQKKFTDADLKNKIKLVVSGDKKDDALYIHQNAYFLLGNFEKGSKGSHIPKNKANGIHFFVIQGSVTLENEKLKTADAAEITISEKIEFKADEKSKILIIEVPMN